MKNRNSSWYKSLFVTAIIVDSIKKDSVLLSDLKLNGNETFNIGDLSDISSKPNQKFNVKINYPNSVKEISVISRIDTEKEVDYFKNDGILPYVFNLIKA